MKRILLTISMVYASCAQLCAGGFPIHVNPHRLLYAIERKENPTRNLSAVGDRWMQYRAYGLLQIRAPYLRDVNRIAGRRMIRRVWSKNWLTLADMKNPKKAEWALRVYLSYYGRLYAEETGRIPNIAVYARIHNGGPDGWKKWDTFAYGQDVVRLYYRHYRRA